MKDFSDDVVDILTGSITMYRDAKNIKNKLNTFIENVTSDDIDVPIEEFINLYDLRIYNFDTKRSDIKALKSKQIKGAYIFYNADKNTYFSGYGSDIFRKVDRHFRGYGDLSVYNNWKNGDRYFVRMSFCDEKNDDPVLLEKQLRECYENRRIKVNKEIENQQKKTRDRKKKKEVRKQKLKNFFARHYKKIILLFICILLLGSSILVYKEYKMYKIIDFSSGDLIGKDYDDVKAKLNVLGFSNISFKDIEDLPLTQISKEKKVTNIIVNNKKYDFNSKPKFHFKSIIILEFHTLKRIPFPYSSDELKGKNYKKVYRVLKEKGFCNIVCRAEKDLIIGFINHKNEIKRVVINGEDEFEKNSRFKINEKIIVEYHSFK